MACREPQNCNITFGMLIYLAYVSKLISISFILNDSDTSQTLSYK